LKKDKLFKEVLKENEKGRYFLPDPAYIRRQKEVKKLLIYAMPERKSDTDSESEEKSMSTSLGRDERSSLMANTNQPFDTQYN